MMIPDEREKFRDDRTPDDAGRPDAPAKTGRPRAERRPPEPRHRERTKSTPGPGLVDPRDLTRPLGRS